jgi:hypothetical protein
MKQATPEQIVAFLMRGQAVIPWRCDVTKNPVGTDTEVIGHSCQCQGCRAGREIERLRALSQNNAHSWDLIVRERDELRAEVKRLRAEIELVSK